MYVFWGAMKKNKQKSTWKLDIETAKKKNWIQLKCPLSAVLSVYYWWDRDDEAANAGQERLFFIPRTRKIPMSKYNSSNKNESGHG